MSVRLIVEGPDQVARFAAPKPRRPDRAVVYSLYDGTVEIVDDGSGRLRGLGWLRAPYRYRYEVDIGEHHKTGRIESIPVLASGGIYAFETTVSVTFRVTDPAEVVRRNIDDALPPVFRFLGEICREIAATFEIEAAKSAENAINNRLHDLVGDDRGYHGSRRQRGYELEQGISILWATVQLRPDQKAREYLTAIDTARRKNLVGAERHELHRDEARRASELALREQSARHELEGREREILRNSGTRARDWFIEFLARRPEVDIAEAFRLFSAAEEATQARVKDAQERQRELLELLLDRGMVRASDLDAVRERLVGAVAEIGPGPVRDASVEVSDEWDAPLPPTRPSAMDVPVGASPDVPAAESHGSPHPVSDVGPSHGHGIIPIYFVFDESLGEWVPGLNEAIRSLYDALKAEPEIARVIRLSVLGFADDVDIKRALEWVADGSEPPRLSPGGGVNYARLFDRLLDCIPRDVETLKARYASVRRPQVLFVGGRPPADPNGWQTPHRHLVDRQALPVGPEIVTWGMGETSPEALADVASQREYAFVAVDPDIGRAIAQLTTFIRSFVMTHGRSIIDGEALPAFPLAGDV